MTRFPQLLLTGVLAAGVCTIAACSSGESPTSSAPGGAGGSAPQQAGGGGMAASGAAGTGGTIGAGTGGGGAGAGAGASNGGTSATGGAGAAAGGAAGGSGGASGLMGTQAIMVLGSSNERITCWRAFLWQKLKDASIENFDFVGDVTEGPDCNVPGYDKDLRAENGIIVSNLPASKYQEWFTAHPPDIILMHFGGADLLQNMPVDGVMKAYSLALAEARKVKPHVRLLVAQHTPQDSNGCAACDAKLLELNADIVPWAAANSTSDSPVTAIDLYTDIVPATDLSDGVHLNESGSHKVAARFFAALEPLFKP